MSYLNDSQIEFFNKNGYLAIPNYLNDDEIEILKAKSDEIIDAFGMEEVRIFTTDEQSQHTDHYFLESGDKIRCFLEEDALDEKGNLKGKKATSINKIGHAMHDLDKDFERISYKKELYQLAIQLGHNMPAIVQSQYIFKQPRIGGKVNPHIDSTFITTSPLSCLGAWIALEDADEENGCLCIIPESHLEYPIQSYFQRDQENKGTKFVNSKYARVEWDITKLIPVTAKKGDLILLHGEVVHASYENRSSRSRQAYVLHLIDFESQWLSQNWLQRPTEFPFRPMKNVVHQ